MPADLTIFAAKYLIFIAAALAAVVLVVLLYGRPRSALVQWLIAAALTLVLSLVFAKIGGAVFNDPRPFTEDHVKPLITHARDNGFPSEHALLAAAIVALVALADVRFALLFVIPAVLVDWARVGAGIHHVADVIGSSILVAIAALIAYFVAPILTRLVAPYIGGDGTEAVAAESRSLG